MLISMHLRLGAAQKGLESLVKLGEACLGYIPVQGGREGVEGVEVCRVREEAGTRTAR